MKHARQRNNIASADYTMNSRLSHLIVDDFNDYAALLGINQVLPDTLPHTTNTPVEGYLKTEDSILSQSNQRQILRPDEKGQTASFKSSISKETFKRQIKNQFRDTLKTSGQLRHILARQQITPNVQTGVYSRWDNRTPLAEESHTQNNDSVFQSEDMNQQPQLNNHTNDISQRQDSLMDEQLLQSQQSPRHRNEQSVDQTHP